MRLSPSRKCLYGRRPTCRTSHLPLSSPTLHSSQGRLAHINVFWRRAVQDEVVCLGWISVVAQQAGRNDAAVYQRKMNQRIVNTDVKGTYNYKNIGRS
jgi:hypothetical protein